MAANNGTVTISESRWARVQRALKTSGHEEMVAGRHKRAGEHFEHGKYGEGLIEVGGAYAPLVTAAVAGGAIFWLAESKTFREMEFVKKHWWVRGLAGLLLAVFLWKKGYATWAMALVGTAMGILIADYNNREKKETAGPDAGDDEAGYWVGDRWYPHYRWEEPRRLERARARERWEERLADRVFEPAI